MSPRQEKDSMGTVQVPDEAYYGAQTQRAKENFNLSGMSQPAALLRALALIKKHAARVNRDLGLLSPNLAEAIIHAARSVAAAPAFSMFPLDVFQTGSGTSTNMNMNEVIAGMANESLTGRRGGKDPVHPNDHVNLGQSSNDVFPSAIHLAALQETRGDLLPALKVLQASLAAKAAELAGVAKTGRTHLQDAAPVTLGQEFGGYARQVELGLHRIQSAQEGLFELALGGTAVGTGINAHPEFASLVIAALCRETGLPLVEATNHFEAQAAKDAAVMFSGALKTLAVSLTKIANDIRWLASGPRSGLGEINLPALQPGSSIMPGKINPVIPEAVIQATAQVMGNDLSITLGGEGGFFELNTMMPLMAHNLLQSIGLLARSAVSLATKSVDGIQANEERAAATLKGNLSLVAFLVPEIGYDAAAEIAKEAQASGKTISQVALRRGVLCQKELERLLSGFTGS